MNIVTAEFPGVPIWTIHDSIMTTVDMVEHIKWIMEDTTEKLLGFKPTIAIEN